LAVYPRDKTGGLDIRRLTYSKAGAVMSAARVATDARQLCRYTIDLGVAMGLCQQRHEGPLEVESVQVSGG
jgi:hypothetical protein